MDIERLKALGEKAGNRTVWFGVSNDVKQDVVTAGKLIASFNTGQYVGTGTKDEAELYVELRNNLPAIIARLESAELWKAEALAAEATAKEEQMTLYGDWMRARQARIAALGAGVAD